MQSARFPPVGKRGPGRRAARRASLARAPLSLTLALLIGLPTASVLPAPLPTLDTGAMQPGSVGTVRGFILDAETRRPLQGARISVEERGSFAQSGPTVAETNGSGQYAARAQNLIHDRVS